MMVSIVISILNSHEIVRRQIEHFKQMDLPDDIEFIFVDDGSDPPLRCAMRNLNLFFTGDKRPWTQGLARNLGALKSKGKYLFFTDIDHIITREALDASLSFIGDKMVFPRYYGILDEKGNVTHDVQSLLDFGLHPARVHTGRGWLCAGFHGNTYLIKKEAFSMIGGYNRQLCESGFHVGGRYPSEESRFNNQYGRLVRLGLAREQVIGPKIYFFPVGKYRTDGNNNPFGLFHGLSLEQPLPDKG